MIDRIVPNVFSEDTNEPRDLGPRLFDLVIDHTDCQPVRGREEHQNQEHPDPFLIPRRRPDEHGKEDHKRDQIQERWHGRFSFPISSSTFTALGFTVPCITAVPFVFPDLGRCAVPLCQPGSMMVVWVR
jgi:hypothetical protein